MKDIRAIAEARAKQRSETGTAESQRTTDSSFQSERARAKEALRREVNSYSGDDVHKISATAQAARDDRILRVAAYCRVSTDDIDQLMSIELQKKHYREMITANPKWKYVGTYVDDGFSGTNTDHRPAFKLMMKDAMEGKVDMIITKSVSRFARNLLDCIFLPSVKDPENPKARPKPGRAVYRADWRDSFGIPVVDHSMSTQINLMDGYEFADMGSKQSSPEQVSIDLGGEADNDIFRRSKLWERRNQRRKSRRCASQPTAAFPQSSRNRNRATKRRWRITPLTSTATRNGKWSRCTRTTASPARAQRSARLSTA